MRCIDRYSVDPGCGGSLIRGIKTIIIAADDCPRAATEESHAKGIGVQLDFGRCSGNRD